MPRRPDRLSKTILTPAEVKRILNAPDTQTPKGIRDRAILEMFYSTGLRAREMWALTVQDVDWRNGFVRVNKGKFCKDRVVPLGRKACDYLRNMLIPLTPVASFSRNRLGFCESPSPTMFGMQPSVSSGGCSERQIHRGGFVNTSGPRHGACR